MAGKPSEKKTEGERVTLAGFSVRLVRRRVRRVTIAVLPPYGEVRVTAPKGVSQSELERIVSGKSAWIVRKTAAFPAAPARERRYGEGECVLLWGRRLPVIPRVEKAGVFPVREGIILSAPSDSPEKRAAVLAAFYREEVAREATKLLPVLREMTGLSPTRLTVRKMARRWGTCYHKTGTVNLSLSLAEYPPVCLTYVLLHELLHLRYPNHGSAFHAALDRYMPDNRAVAATLNRLHRLAAVAWAEPPDGTE